MFCVFFLFFKTEIDATLFPFLSADNPEFQTGSLGPDPMGLLYLHCISPTTSSAFPLFFHLSLGLHPSVSLRDGKNVSGPLPFRVLVSRTNYQEMDALGEFFFARLWTAELSRDSFVFNLCRLTKVFIYDFWRNKKDYMPSILT